jgi:hypothetical protein
LEDDMPHRRRVEKGSFGGKLDDLIKVFPGEVDGKRPAKSGSAYRHGDEGHINDKLFESAWRRAREQQKRPGRP